jgi:hypothetical protein
VLSLPDVTLFVIDGGVALPLTRLALSDTLKQIKPAKVLIFSAQPEVWRQDGYDVLPIGRCRSAEEAMRVMWYKVPNPIETSHMLHVEWDGWVINAEMWRDEYLDYDYIGAPWPWYQDDHKVGNGLGVRSVRLMRFLRDNPTRFPLPLREDEGICRVYRPALEQEGFRFAPLELATEFSWERGPCPGPTFAYHGCFNWPQVLDMGALMERLDLATEYERGKPEWWEMLDTVPVTQWG